MSDGFLRVRSAAELDPINDIIHDRWIDLAACKWSAHSQTIEIPIVLDYALTRRKPRSEGAKGRRLSIRIGHVLDYELQDSKGIQFYDIDVIEFDPNTSTVTVVCNIPCVCRARVSELDVYVMWAGMIRGVPGPE